MAGTIYKQFALARTAFYLLLIGLFLCFSASVKAETDPAYTIEGVEVDVTAANAVKAREKALDEAQVKAYQMLAEKFLTAEEMANFKVPDPITISSLVQDFEVTKEQLSSKRYKGTYTIRFRPTAMKSQLAAQGVPIAGGIPKPVLVLPFFQSGMSTSLWNETNPWMMAWRTMPTDRSMMQPTVLPLGDASDMSYIADEEGLQYDPVRVQELATKYNADDVAILMASTVPTPTSQGRVTIDIYNNGFEGPVFVQKVIVDQMAGETDQSVYARAAHKVKDVLRQNWKENAAYVPPPAPNTVTMVETTTYGQPVAVPPQAPPVAYTKPALGPSQSYIAQARFASVQDWVRMKNTLDRVYGMQAVMIKTLKPREALLDMRFAGDLPRLQMALQNAGITMRANANSVLEIHMGASYQQPVYQ